MIIKKPTVIIDEKRVRRNIERMALKAQKNGVRFRPHFKTHQSAEIGEIFKEFGISEIAVSSIDMAAYFAKHGWKDIMVSIPVNIRQIEEINTLAGQISLGLLTESMESADFLAENIVSPVNVWIEIDTGDNRTGLDWKDTEKIAYMAAFVDKSKNLHLAGILTHAGHSYEKQSSEAVEKVHKDSISRMNDVKDYLFTRGFKNIEISTGDTPTCNLMSDFSGTDEIRPGNFVFNDLLQKSIGSCSEADIAIAVACPVISKHPERNELVIYGGGAHLSSDFLEWGGKRMFGLVALPGPGGWTVSVRNAFINRITQEHGSVRAEKDFIAGVNTGDILMILPVHSCLTATLHQTYQTLDGKTLISFHYEISLNHS